MTGGNNIITTVNITRKYNVINNMDNFNPCTLCSLFCNNTHLFTETLIVIFGCYSLTKSTLIVIISCITSKILLYKKHCRISGILHSKCIED